MIEIPSIVLSMSPFSVRKLHRKIAPILFLPLCISAITGIVYYLGIHWFGLENKKVGFLLSLHQGSFLGTALKPIYVLLVGLGLLGLIVTGFSMVRQISQSRLKVKTAKLDDRSIHRITAPIAFLPLSVSALTGLGYRMGRSWFDLPRKQAEILINLHAGEYLGDVLSPIYVLLLGLGLLFLLGTGIKMTGIFRKRPSGSA